SVARVDIVRLLLDSGANPSFKLPIKGMTALDIVLDILNQVRDKDSVEKKLTAIKTLLEEAMKKHPPSH
ncbi:MAG TPA: hypothetical protein VJ201_06210, partial [Candidatus Babeliales bacterium]|nr:hypothetical protein [Candidatus Babeliales bacterium]